MARPKGSRSIRGWMITPTEMSRAGLIDPADLERVEQGKDEHAVMVTRLKPSAVERLDDELERIKEDARSGDDEFFLVDTKGAKEALASLVEAKRDTKAPRGEIERKVFAEEKRIRNNPYETLIVIAQDGRVLRQKGEAYSVSASSEQIKVTAGSISTHNHPGRITRETERNNPVARKVGGGSFSPADVTNTYMMARAEFRAVTPKLEYRLKNNNWKDREFSFATDNNRTWSEDKKRFLSAYKRKQNEVQKKAQRLINQGKLSPNDMGAAYWHLVARQFTKGNKGYASQFEYNVTGDSKALAELARIESIYDAG